MIEPTPTRPVRRAPILLAGAGFLLIDFVLVNSLPGVELLPGYTGRFSLWYLPLFALASIFLAAGLVLGYPSLHARLAFRTGTPAGGKAAATPAPAPEIGSRFFNSFFFANLYLSIFLALVVARLLAPYLDQPRVFRDTELYVVTAEVPLSDPAFWQAERSFTVPLVYKLLGIHTQNYEKRLALARAGDFQSGLALVAWAALGLSLATSLRLPWLRPVAFGLLAFTGLTLDVVQWDRVLLSESLSTSLFVLWIAAWLLSAWAWRRERVPAWLRLLLVVGNIAIALLYAFTRDTNAYLVLLAAGLLVLGLLFRPARAHPARSAYLLLLAGLLLIYFANAYTVSAGRRWQVPFYDILARRLLLEPPARDYFQAHGLPVDAGLLALSGLEPHEYQRLLRSDPRFAAARAWIDAYGRSTYLRYLLSRPLDSLRRPLDDLRELVSPDPSEYRNPLILPPRWMAWLTRLLTPRPVVPLLIALGLLAAGLVFLALHGGLDPAWLVPLALLATAYPLSFLVWHGGTLELERHAVQIALQLRLAGWMMAFLLADYLLSRFLASRLQFS